MDLSEQLRTFLQSCGGQTPRTTRTTPPFDLSEEGSARCARDSGEGPSQNPPAEWTEDALFVYLERLAIADDLELDTGLGSPAEAVALREARRVLAGFPVMWPASRQPAALDEALAAFEPLGGLRFVGFITTPEGVPQ